MPPVHVKVAGKPLDVQRSGHAAPFVGDINGDGRMDLLVGQFESGQLRIYHNTGTATKPKFTRYEWLQAGGEKARAPVG